MPSEAPGHAAFGKAEEDVGAVPQPAGEGEAGNERDGARGEEREGPCRQGGSGPVHPVMIARIRRVRNRQWRAAAAILRKSLK